MTALVNDNETGKFGFGRTVVLESVFQTNGNGLVNGLHVSTVDTNNVDVRILLNNIDSQTTASLHVPKRKEEEAALYWNCPSFFPALSPFPSFLSEHTSRPFIQDG